MIAVCAAAALQSATGIGFGVIAGPILLLTLRDSSAIQVSIMLNLCIALLLTPALWRYADRRALVFLLPGLAAGTPLGMAVFLHIDLAQLKLVAALAVAGTLLLVLGNDRKPGAAAAMNAGGIGFAAAGLAAGVMGACLAMPGPVPAAWLAARGFGKETVRATTLVMFVAAYGLALLLQLGFAAPAMEVVTQTLELVPATLLGVAGGHLLGRRISENVYRRVLAAILATTVILLLASLW